jgi:hypothetical protein
MVDVCPTEVHERMKADPVTWAALEQLEPMRDDDGNPEVELANCACGSTLARFIQERP